MKKNKKDVACGAKGQKTTAACGLISMMNNERLHCGQVTSDSCETRGSLKSRKDGGMQSAELESQHGSQERQRKSLLF